MDELARCYFVLGLEAGASPAEIKEAWRDLAQVWHPDRFSGNSRLQNKAQEKLKQINEAYEKLRNHRAGLSASTTWSQPSGGYDSAGYAGEPDVDPLSVLSQGVTSWNLWRKKYSNVRPSLRMANLNGMKLEGIDLREADLGGAALQSSDLYKANLSGAIAMGARFQRSDLSRALLLGANLRLADLSEADLSGADLSGADLNRCKLPGANLVAANFSGADLREATGLTPQQMAYTSTDDRTKLPDYL